METQRHQTRVERIVGAPLAEDAVREWPQSGELIRGRDRIAEVEAGDAHAGADAGPLIRRATGEQGRSGGEREARVKQRHSHLTPPRRLAGPDHLNGFSHGSIFQSPKARWHDVAHTAGTLVKQC